MKMIVVTIAMVLVLGVGRSDPLVVSFDRDIQHLHWSSSGNVLYASTYDGVFAIDVDTADVHQLYAAAEQAFYFDVARDDRIALFDGVYTEPFYDATLTIFFASRPSAPLATTNVAWATAFERLRWSPDGARIATTTMSGRVFDAKTGTLAQVIPFPPDQDDPFSRINNLDWLDDDRLLLLVNVMPYVYELSQQAFVERVPIPDGGRVALPLSPDRTQMLVLRDQQFHVVSTQTWEVTAAWEVSFQVDEVFPIIAWQPSGQTVWLTTLSNPSLLGCSLIQQRCESVRSANDIRRFMYVFAIHPDGHLLAYAMGGDIYLLDLTDALAELGLDVAD